MKTSQSDSSVLAFSIPFSELPRSSPSPVKVLAFSIPFSELPRSSPSPVKVLAVSIVPAFHLRSSRDMVDVKTLLREHLPSDILAALNAQKVCPITLEQLRPLCSAEQFEQARQATESGYTLHLNYDGMSVLVLVWNGENPDTSPELAKCDWEIEGGRIRNQREHRLCWAYASSDLHSAARVINEDDKKYKAFCPWYLCECAEPDLLLEDLDNVGHHCYEYLMEDALEHMVDTGIPREVRRVYDCRKRPTTLGDVKYKIDSVQKFSDLRSALAHLPNQPIGADIILCNELWDKSTKVYRGPLFPGSIIQGYHSVIIIRVIWINGEAVAICKSSNGTGVGDKGYFRVSLSVFYSVLRCDEVDGEHVRPGDSMNLLSDFVCPRLPKQKINIACPGNPKEKVNNKRKRDA
ncbi:unnamed protein product [Eruca vesicaria subsp. sativa]|uniref:Peptidase C1A papain C-terminal domain-containing protein n=1 Tax=Eruca vesicaria subsp. sativa TaxID=29727 RepID=A0ABC8LT26_ERUVS|nr:unnamed protein product [Eruca vesicaria subsp. sativa]